MKLSIWKLLRLASITVFSNSYLLNQTQIQFFYTELFSLSHSLIVILFRFMSKVKNTATNFLTNFLFQTHLFWNSSNRNYLQENLATYLPDLKHIYQTAPRVAKVCNSYVRDIKSQLPLDYSIRGNVTFELWTKSFSYLLYVKFPSNEISCIPSQT